MYTRILYGNLCCNMEMSKVQSRCRWKLGRIETSLEKGSWRFNNKERDHSKYWGLTRHFFQNALSNRFLDFKWSKNYYISLLYPTGKREVYARSPLPTPISEHAKHWSAVRRLFSLDVSLCVPHYLRPIGLLVIFFHSFSVTCQ
jgi:hypothetical protein